jgi:hypothetical protein
MLMQTGVVFGAGCAEAATADIINHIDHPKTVVVVRILIASSCCPNSRGSPAPRRDGGVRKG